MNASAPLAQAISTAVQDRLRLCQLPDWTLPNGEHFSPADQGGKLNWLDFKDLSEHSHIVAIRFCGRETFRI